MMIDAACGVNAEPKPLQITEEHKKACALLATAVVSDLRYYYPDVMKTRPTTWPIHLRNTISKQAEMMLRDILENATVVAAADSGPKTN